MKILVTGGTGFIGSRLIEKLLKQKHRIVVLTRKGSDTWRLPQTSNLELFEYSDLRSITNLFDSHSFDSIIHLATKYIKQNETYEDIITLNETNITLPSLLLKLATAHNVRNFINTGTCFEYKRIENAINEQAAIEPINYYAATKVAFEDILKHVVQISSLRAITLKLFFPYGERDNRKLISVLMDSFVNNKALELTQGEQQLDFTYVDDIADAYVKALDYLQSNAESRYEVFNIGAGVPVRIKDIVTTLEQITIQKPDIKFSRPYPQDEIMYMSADNIKARHLLDWKPQFDITKGLSKTYTYYKSHPERL